MTTLPEHTPPDHTPALGPSGNRQVRVSRREVLVVVGVTAALWLVASQLILFVPLRLLVTLVHEAGHAVTATLFGGEVLTVTVNRHGGGLMRSRATDPSTTYQVLVASAGYLGTAMVGGLLLELSRRLRGGRIALGALALIVAAVGVAWVPWTFEPDPISAMATGSGSGDGRFTILVCILAVAVLVGLAVQPVARLRRAAILVIATCLCLGAVEDLQLVLDISRRGGHSDAALAAAVTPLSSWMWAAIWMLLGVAACVLGTWSAVGRDAGAVERQAAV
jgi:hypothetical protein